MNDWMPIQTAPKDGSLLLLYWKRDDQHVMEAGWWEAAPADRCWYAANEPCRPSHWMRLPAPPAEPST